ncbi:MAG: ATP-binding protein, partial [Verrucomicrobiota bacterium]
EANAAKDKFFSIIAHDLRGPMAGIMQLAELLANEEHSHSDSEIREMKLNISLQASNTFNLLENLLEWSQINRVNFNFNPQKISLSKVVQECANFLAEQLRGKEIELVIGIPNNKEVIADKTMLNIIIRNLLSNAIKFTRKGGLVTISVNEAANNQTMISVKDTGIGMAEELKNNLFRIDANTRRRGTQGESSTGLGLQLCKEFVEIQGGKMSIKSQQNVGSVFSFTIPSANPSKKISRNKIIVPDEIKKSPPKILNLLIVEDDDITYSLLKIIVRKVSNEFYRAFSGTEAIEFCLQHPELDLILMDIRLPVMNGYEATQQIRLFNKEVIIIAQTAQATDNDRNLVLDAGCNDFISKPYDIKKLMEMITVHFKN